ncbi:MAG: translation initiation factor IF-3 [Candidatus Spechtbacteria bacterium RIFCSPLOWO2_01_FULL_43_12]|uniref:Translation initiation factor IF-3 n=1 Tax=Candidatus Spechtbacteria bacterium RIFCSPLOWO2_01_FULL_43_12 TaxID=1802162 RepID=A0A1G2HGM4_9BACT|nr:MAG: translation initiation factor IF-3 [Candidatus Spechtbacteria bacterium RIFCSPLOWO2_01_FULL_43_12]
MIQNRRFQTNTPHIRKNEQISAPEVRLLDEKGNNLGIVKTAEAIKKAREAGLDLIEISGKAVPPVARIMDHGKYLYQQEKKDKDAKKKQETGSVMKGVRIGMQTSEHDTGIKAGLVDKFLKKGYKVRVELIMKGREKALQDMGNKKVEDFLSALSEEHEVEQGPKKSPRGIYFIIRKR